MQAPGIQAPPFKGAVWMPPVSVDLLSAVILVIIGANIEVIPEQYRTYIANPIAIFVGMLIAAGFAALGMMPLAFATAFALVNLVRIMPVKKIQKVVPGVKEGFVPSGTFDWVIPNKKWFVEKVLMEKPIAIQEKEVSTYPIQA
jgi:hypothetical protein